MNVVFLNSGSSVSPQDRGLLYGDGFFTTILIANHKPVFWRAHVERIKSSLHRLRFAEFDVESLEQHFDSLPLWGVLKIVITRGAGPRGYEIPKQPEPQCYLQLIELDKLPASEWHRLKLCHSDFPVSINPALAGVKHLNRLDNVIARSDAIERGFDDALMSNDESIVCATQSNVFFVLSEHFVVTPSIKKSGVQGVMKRQVIQWLEKLGIEVIEKIVTRSDSVQAQEIFLTNCVKGIQSVSFVEDRQYDQFSIAGQLRQMFQNTITQNK